MKGAKLGALLLGVALFGVACGNDSPLREGKPIQPNDPYPGIIYKGWQNVSKTFGNLPAYIQIYHRRSTPSGKLASIYLGVADMRSATFSVSTDIHWSSEANGNGNESLYTLSEFYERNGKPALVINGGLFFSAKTPSGNIFYYSQSACYSGGKMLSHNQNYWSKNWADFWYPTLGVFYKDKGGQYHALWSYYNKDGNDYAYTECKQIDRSKPETNTPDANYPTQGKVLNKGEAIEGIGGVSVLISNGQLKNTWHDELLDVSANTAQPRTAIGYDTQTNKMFFLVCEGRNEAMGIAGMTTAQEADLLLGVGCTEALNLDGGGSSCMLVNGKETINPSDGHQRKVINACFIK